MVSADKGPAFSDGPHANEQRRFSLRALKDLNNLSDSAEVEERILEEASDLIQRLDKRSGTPMSVNQFFYRSSINCLLEFLVSKKFAPDDPQLAEICYYITRYTVGESSHKDSHSERISGVHGHDR